MPTNKNWTWTAPRRQIVKNLWNQGWTAITIAEELGPHVTKNMVLGIAHGMGLKPRQKSALIKKPVSKKALKLAKPFNQLETRECHFPLGEWLEKSKLFCAQPVYKTSSYCSTHYKLCHQKTGRTHA